MLPENESGVIPYFLAEYILKNIDNAKSVVVVPIGENGLCEYFLDNTSIIDVILN